jgi:hypothetical protein
MMFILSDGKTGFLKSPKSGSQKPGFTSLVSKPLNTRNQRNQVSNAANQPATTLSSKIN